MASFILRRAAAFAGGIAFLITPFLVGVLLLSLLAACSDYGDDPTYDPPLPVATVITATGDLTQRVAEFRAALGDPNNGATKGQQTAGRREISWDGVAAANTNTNTFPGDFFNATRGLVMTTTGTGFRVSDNDFADLNPLYDADFDDFSPARTFMSVGSNVTDNTFRVAGDTTVAGVRGFGVVFSDVDRSGSTYVEFFDAAGRRLAKVLSPVRSDARGFTFVGAVFTSPVVARVRIVSGDGSLGGTTKDVTDGGTLDLVVMDDFIYGEPTKP